MSTKKYWDNKTSSGQRNDSTEFLYSKAKEQAFALSLDESTKLKAIDLGCGAGELLDAYLKFTNLNLVAGLDFSSSMLSKAKERIGDQIDLIQDDIFKFLPETNIEIWISTQALSQYLQLKEIKKSIQIFKENSNAKVFAFFDTIDPVKYSVMNLGGSYRQEHIPKPGISANFKLLIKRLLFSIKFTLGKYSKNQVYLDSVSMGYGYPPYVWLQISNEFGLDIELHSSKLYEYRYHVILRK